MWPRIAAALGGAVLLGSLWFTWYRFEPTEADGEALINDSAPSDDGFQVVQGLIAIEGDLTKLRAWDVLSAPETVALAAIALVAIAALVRPVAASAVRVLGAIAVALVVFRVVEPPEFGFHATTGAFVALAGALVAWAGAWLTRRDLG